MKTLVTVGTYECYVRLRATRCSLNGLRVVLAAELGRGSAAPDSALAGAGSPAGLSIQIAHSRAQRAIRSSAVPEALSRFEASSGVTVSQRSLSGRTRSTVTGYCTMPPPWSPRRLTLTAEAV